MSEVYAFDERDELVQVNRDDVICKKYTLIHTVMKRGSPFPLYDDLPIEMDIKACLKVCDGLNPRCKWYERTNPGDGEDDD